MTRSYTQKRRAEKREETRRRIVDATVDLHGTVGPAFTSLSMIAERAGVQRNTLYAHFPDERSLYLACSGAVLERDPLPDAAAWADIADADARRRAGLRAVYDWYARNADIAGCVLRDAETDPLTREMIDLRMAPGMAQWEDVLGADLGRSARAVLRLALGFFAWRSLVGDSKLGREDAVDAMVAAIAAADGRAGAAGRRRISGT